MKYLKHIALIAAAVLAASCSIYHPQAVDIPLLDEPGQTRIDAAVAASSILFVPTAITFGGTVSHSFDHNIAAQLHFNHGGDNYYLQAAPGMYTRSGEKFVLEGYAGLGFGGAHYESLPDSNGIVPHHYNGTYALPFVQLNLGWRHLGPMEFAFGFKTGAFIPSFTIFNTTSDGNTEKRHYSQAGLLTEPQFQLRVGSENVKYTLRISFTHIGGFYQGSDNFTYSHFTLSNGLTFTF